MNVAVIVGEVAFISRSKIMAGIVDAARKDGTNVFLFTCEGFMYHHMQDYSEGEYNIFRLPNLEDYDGVIVDLDSIQNLKVQEYLYDIIKKSNVPCVSFNRKVEFANEIYFDNDSGFRKLVEHLIVEHKVENFHFISGSFGNRDAMQRLDVFKQVLCKHNLSIADENIYEGDFNFGSGKALAQKYINHEKNLPQAIVAANDFMAIGLMEELKENGIRVPEDVIVTGYDNCEIATLTQPKLTTVDRGEYEAGMLAYRKLVSNMNETEEGTCDIVYGKPVFAGSCGCQKCKMGAEADMLAQSAVELKVSMDESLDLIKGLNIGLSNMEKLSDLDRVLGRYIKKMGMESFYFCQCGSRESYYEELEILASGRRIRRNMTVYQDMVWCPIAYENGRWTNYPSYSRRLLFPPAARIKREGGYYIIMPVHQGETCIGYSIIGNFNNNLSGRVLQHLVLGIDAALGNIRKQDIMSTMLARINQKWQYDELTGLYNRSGLLNSTEKLLEKAIAEDKGIAVIFFDLDGLKAINDTKGHEAGDQYIKLMAECLKQTTTEEDVVCRYGGDEYIVISKQESEEDCLILLDTVKTGIASQVAASAGCVFERVTKMDEIKRLIEVADQKMYENKKRKRES